MEGKDMAHGAALAAEYLRQFCEREDVTLEQNNYFQKCGLYRNKDTPKTYYYKPGSNPKEYISVCEAIQNVYELSEIMGFQCDLSHATHQTFPCDSLPPAENIINGVGTVSQTIGSYNTGTEIPVAETALDGGLGRTNGAYLEGPISTFEPLVLAKALLIDMQKFWRLQMDVLSLTKKKYFDSTPSARHPHGAFRQFNSAWLLREMPPAYTGPTIAIIAAIFNANVEVRCERTNRLCKQHG